MAKSKISNHRATIDGERVSRSENKKPRKAALEKAEARKAAKEAAKRLKTGKSSEGEKE